jgi:hypothetical protein
MRVETILGETMCAKDAVRALLDRLPDDCRLDEVIEQILLLEGPWLDQANLPPLTRAQQDALDESIAHLERDPDSAIPWRDALQRIRSRE